MANQKISELTAIATIDNATDVLPIVDTSATTTKKITLTQVKTSLALNNVDNTSDANKPVSTATQTALDAKQATLVSGTNIKTINSTSVLGSGNVAVEPTITATTSADYYRGDKTFATLNKTAVALGNVDNTSDANKPVSTATQTALNAKQDTLVSATNIKTINSTSILGSGDVAVQATLVSGTNIKTINSTSLLGSGDIVLSASPSGVSGAIQFSNGSAFASDAANFFWDDTNNRLGLGTATPTGTLQIKGSGSTSATISLLVQNSAGTEAVKVRDDGSVFYTSGYFNIQTSTVAAPSSGAQLNFNISGNGPGMTITNQNGTTYRIGQYNTGNVLSIGDAGAGTPVFNINLSGNIGVGTTAPNATAILDITSTTKGVLFPRMTTTQKNAIASPATGLVVYDNTTNKLQCYNGSTWNDLF
jgi:hypothetical protein